jgi:5-(carboxyamino)imidazole ribonucleotide mutase
MQLIVCNIMGSTSDWDTMKSSADILDKLSIPYEVRVVFRPPHPRSPLQYAASARERGLDVIIAGAGGAAHLPRLVTATHAGP